MSVTTKQQFSEKQKTEFCKRQQQRLARRFGNLVWDDVYIPEVRRMIGDMLQEFGPERTEVAVTGVIDGEQFFNGKQSLLDRLPPSPQQAIEMCPLCNDLTGMIAVRQDSGDELPYRDKYRLPLNVDVYVRSCKHGH